MLNNPNSEHANLDMALRHIENSPLEELAPILAALARKINDHRNENHGFVPREVFAEILGIAGQSTCLEYIPRVVNTENETVGYLLKQRGGSDQGWKGEYNIPGGIIVIVPDQDLMEFASRRIRLDFDFDGFDADSVTRVASGFESHYEAERDSTCLTLIFTIDIPEAVLPTIDETKGWRFFPVAEIDSDAIVDHHRNTLRWHSNPNRSDFELVDLRSHLRDMD